MIEKEELLRTSASMKEFIDASPSMIQAESRIRDLLVRSGSQELDERQEWNLEPGSSYHLSRNQSALIAFRLGELHPAESGFRVAAAHTDSPMLKLKPQAQAWQGDYLCVSTEIYGGPILSTWLDRDLGLAGTAKLRVGGRTEVRGFAIHEPLFVLPNLAIHLNRNINKGFEYNTQDHLKALCLLDFPSPRQERALEHIIARELGVDQEQVTGGDWYLFPLEPARYTESGNFLSARLDNLAGCHAVLRGFQDAIPGSSSQIAVFYNHEEIGSSSLQGAASAFFVNTVRRILAVYGGSPEAEFLAAARSFQVSVDAAHSWHPLYPEKFDPAYRPILGKGPVLKQNASQKYATDTETESVIEELAAELGLPIQYQVNRSDIPSGSTIGPLSATRANIPTVDIGIPLFAMHSIRETAHAMDQAASIRLLSAHFSHTRT